MLDGPFQASPVESIQCPNATVAAVELSSLTHNQDSTGTWTVTGNHAIAAFVHDDKQREERLWKRMERSAKNGKGAGMQEHHTQTHLPSCCSLRAPDRLPNRRWQPHPKSGRAPQASSESRIPLQFFCQEVFRGSRMRLAVRNLTFCFNIFKHAV